VISLFSSSNVLLSLHLRRPNRATVPSSVEGYASEDPSRSRPCVSLPRNLPIDTISILVVRRTSRPAPSCVFVPDLRSRLGRQRGQRSARLPALSLRVLPRVSIRELICRRDQRSARFLGQFNLISPFLLTLLNPYLSNSRARPPCALTPPALPRWHSRPTGWSRVVFNGVPVSDIDNDAIFSG
jgi:hypothetical protein